ncbi:unnamed protein product, partial [Ectocarpus sp. 13 AM-2016]
GEIATLEEEIEKLEFPNVEDGTGNFGEKTMDNAVAMLMAKTGRGFSLKRENKTKLFTKKQEKTSCMRNRSSSVWIKCCQGGKPRACQRVADPSARRNTKSQKVCLPEVRTDVELPMLSSRHRCISALLFSASGDESSDKSREESQWKWTWGVLVLLNLISFWRRLNMIAAHYMDFSGHRPRWSVLSCCALVPLALQ